MSDAIAIQIHSHDLHIDAPKPKQRVSAFPDRQQPLPPSFSLPTCVLHALPARPSPARLVAPVDASLLALPKSAAMLEQRSCPTLPIQPHHLVDWQSPSRVLRTVSRDPMAWRQQQQQQPSHPPLPHRGMASSASAPTLAFTLFARRPVVNTAAIADLLLPKPAEPRPLPPPLPPIQSADYSGTVHVTEGSPDSSFPSNSPPATAAAATAAAAETAVSDDVAAEAAVGANRAERAKIRTSRWATPLPGCGMTFQEAVLDETRRRLGRPRRADWSEHLVNLRRALTLDPHRH